MKKIVIPILLLVLALMLASFVSAEKESKKAADPVQENKTKKQSEKPLSQLSRDPDVSITEKDDYVVIIRKIPKTISDKGTEEIRVKKDRLNDFLEKVEYTDLQAFLEAVKTDIQGKNPDKDVWDRDSFESHIGYYTKVYAKHFAAIEEDPETVKKLDQIAEVADEVSKETDKINRQSKLQELEKLVDQLLIRVDH